MNPMTQKQITDVEQSNLLDVAESIQENLYRMRQQKLTNIRKLFLRIFFVTVLLGVLFFMSSITALVASPFVLIGFCTCDLVPCLYIHKDTSQQIRVEARILPELLQLFSTINESDMGIVVLKRLNRLQQLCAD